MNNVLEQMLAMPGDRYLAAHERFETALDFMSDAVNHHEPLMTAVYGLKAMGLGLLTVQRSTAAINAGNKFPDLIKPSREEIAGKGIAYALSTAMNKQVSGEI